MDNVIQNLKMIKFCGYKPQKQFDDYGWKAEASKYQETQSSLSGRRKP